MSDPQRTVDPAVRNELSYAPESVPTSDARATARMVGGVTIAVGVLTLLCGVAFCMAPANNITGWIMALAVVVYGLLLCISGICIWRGRCWFFSVVISALMTPALPVGTIIGGYTLYVICSRDGGLLYVTRSGNAPPARQFHGKSV
jgi:hypothetical protein